jgi:hypothetical protein
LSNGEYETLSKRCQPIFKIAPDSVPSMTPPASPDAHCLDSLFVCCFQASQSRFTDLLILLICFYSRAIDVSSIKLQRGTMTYKHTAYDEQCPCGRGRITITKNSQGHPWSKSDNAEYEAEIKCARCKDNYRFTEQKKNGRHIALEDVKGVRNPQILYKVQEWAGGWSPVT